MAEEQGKSTLTIELDTRQAKTNARDLAAQLTNVDTALKSIDDKLSATKKWQMKIDMVMNPINVMDEFNKIQRVLKQSNQKIKIDAELKNIGARNEIAKVQSAINKTNQKIKLDVELRTAGVKNEIKKVQDQVASASGKIQISVDTSSAKASASALTAEMKTAMESISKAATALTNHLEAENQKRLADNKKANEAIVANNKRSATDSQNIASKMAASVVSMKPIEDSMKLERTLRESSLAETRRIEAQKAKEAQKAAQEMVKGYVDAYAAINRQVQASAATTRAAMEQTFKSFAAQRKFTPEVKQATFQSKDTASFADIKAIQSESQQVQKAWRDMYAGVQLEAKNNLAATKTLTNAAIADIKTQTQAKIDAIKQESALSASERKNAITSIQASSKAIIDSMRSIPEAAKGSWSGVMDSSKAAMNAGIAAAKATETAQITGFKNVEAAKRASDKAIEEADNAVLSNLEARLRRSSAAAKAMVDEFARLQGLGNYEAVKNLETSLDRLRTGFANIKFGDNTAQLNGIQDKLTSAYQKAADAAKAYSEGRVNDAIRIIAETKNEIATLEALKKQILSTGAAATTSLSGRSFMSDSLKQAGEQVEALAGRLRELGSFTRFDAVTALKSQIDNLATSIQKIPNIGSADLVKALDLIAEGYRKVEQASIASSKGQGFAYMSRMADADKALEKVKQLEAELNRFGNAKLQTNQLSAAFEADAKKAIAAANEVKRIKLAAFDEEARKQQDVITERNRANSSYMQAFQAHIANERTIYTRNLEAENRATIENINARLSTWRHYFDQVSRMGESQVAPRETMNRVAQTRQNQGVFNVPGTSTAGLQTSTQEAIRQQGVLAGAFQAGSEAYSRAMQSNISNTLNWIRNLWLVQKAIQMIGEIWGAVQSGFQKIKDIAVTSQKMATVMTVITESAQSAREEIEWLRAESDKIGISFEAAVTPFAKFAAAAKGMFPREEIRDMFTQLGRVSVAMHLDQVETKGVFLAIQQMASKGKVSLEELRLQFAERIPGAMTIAADSMGMTMTQFVKAVSSGTVMTEDFLPNFLRQLDDTFGKAADLAANSLIGALNRMENAIFKAWETIGKGGAADAIQSVANKIASFLNRNTELLERFGGKVGQVIESLGDSFIKIMEDASFGDHLVQTFTSLISLFERGITVLTNFALGLDSLKVPEAVAAIAAGAAGGLVAGPVGAAAGAGAAITAMGSRYNVQSSQTDTLKNLTAEQQELARQLKEQQRISDDITAIANDVSSGKLSLWNEYIAKTKDATKFTDDLRQAAELALKPNDLEEYIASLLKSSEMIDQLQKKLDALKPETVQSLSPLKTFNVSDQEKALENEIARLQAKRTELERINKGLPKSGAKDLNTQEISVLTKQELDAQNRLRGIHDTIKDIESERVSIKTQLETKTAAEAQVAEKVRDAYADVTDKVKKLNAEIDNVNLRQLDFSLMDTKSLTGATDALKNQKEAIKESIALKQEQIQAVQDSIASMGSDPSVNIAKASASQFISNQKKELDTLVDSLRAYTAAQDRATTSLEKNLEAEYKVASMSRNVAAKFSDKAMVDRLSETGNAPELGRLADEALSKVTELGNKIREQESIWKNTSLTQQEQNAAYIEMLSLQDEMSRQSALANDAKNTQLVLEHKIANAYKEQYKTQADIANLLNSINVELGISSDLATMTADQLLKTVGEFKPIPITTEIDSSGLQDSIETAVTGMKPIEVKLSTGKDITNLVRSAGEKYNVDPALIKAIMKQESGFNPAARGSSGEIGLMQLMPKTADWLNVDPKDIQQNIEGGAKYLHILSTQFKTLDEVIAAYNAGQGNIERRGIFNPEYVKSVKTNLAEIGKETKFNVTLNTENVKTQSDIVKKDISTPVRMDVRTNLNAVASQASKIQQEMMVTGSHAEAYLNYLIEAEAIAQKARQETNPLKSAQLLDQAKARKAAGEAEHQAAIALSREMERRIELSDKLANNYDRILQANQDNLQIEAASRYRGANAVPELRTIADSGKSQIEAYSAQLADIERLTKDGGTALAYNLLQEGRILEFNNEQDKLLRKKVILKAEVDRLTNKTNASEAKAAELLQKQTQILQDQKDALRDISMSNRYGKAGAEYEKMKQFLTPEAFDEWNTDRQQLEIQQFVDAAGLGADSVASSFTNAFSQILVDGASFTDTMKNMFKDMTNRIMNESINLIAKNLMSLGSGGSWAQIGLGVVGVGVGLLSRWANKQGEAKPVTPATARVNPNIIGSTQMYQADIATRDIYVNAMIPTVQKWNDVVNLATTGLRSFSGSITEYGAKLVESISINFKGSMVGGLIDSIKAPFESVYSYVTEFGNKIISGGEQLVKTGSSAILNALGLGTTAGVAGVAIATNAPVQLGTLPVNLTASAGGAVTTASTAIGSKVGVNTISQFGSLPASATGSAASTSASSLSALGGYATMFLSVVKFGYDLFKIIGNKTMTDMAKTSNALDAASTALLGIAAGLAATGVGIIASVVALAIAGVLKVGSAATDSFEKGFSQSNISSLMGGILGDVVNMLVNNKPGATMLAFSGNKPDTGAIWDQQNQYFTSGQQKHDIMFGGMMFPGGGTQSASVGVKTDLGYVSMRLDDIDLKQSQIREMALKTFIPTLDLIKKYNNQLGSAINAIDVTQGTPGITLAQFAKAQESRQWEKEQKLKSFDTGSMLGDLVKNYGAIFKETDTLAGKTAGAWITAFSDAILDPKKNGEYNQIQAFNVMDFVAKMMPELVQLPLAVADLFAKNVKSISMGATQDEFIKQFTDFFTGWEIADKGLKSMGTDIKNTAIPEYLAGLVGLGFTVKDAAVQLVTYANALKEAGGYTNDTLNTIITDLLATAKEKKYTKSQVSGYVQTAAVLGTTALDLGFKSTSDEIKSLTDTLMDATSSATAAANAEIDKLIIDNKLTNVSRDAAIQTMVLAGTLDDAKVRAADFNIALVEQTKKWTDAIGVMAYVTEITGSAFDTTGVAFKDFVKNSIDFVDALGGAEKAMSRLSATFKAAMGETAYSYGSAVADRKKVDQIYAKYGVNDQTVGILYQQAMANKNLTLAQKEQIQSEAEQVLQSKATTQAYYDNTASLRDIVTLSLTPLKAGVDGVDTTTQGFTNTINALAAAFGSADEAAQSLQKSFNLAYSGNEANVKGLNLATINFNDSATKFGFDGLKVEDALSANRYLNEQITSGAQSYDSRVAFNGTNYTIGELLGGLGKLLEPVVKATNSVAHASEGGNITPSNQYSKDSVLAAPVVADPSKMPTSPANTSAEDFKTQQDNLKTLSDLQKQVKDELKSINLTDIEKSIADINSGIDAMIKQATEASGKLEGIEQLRQQKIIKAAQDWGAEYDKSFGRLGNSDVTNSLLDVSDKFIKLNQEAEVLAAQGLFKLPDALAKSVALKQEEVAKIVKGIVNPIDKEFAAIGKNADISGIADYVKEQQKNLTDLYNGGAITLADGMVSNSKVIAIAYEKLTNVFKDVNADFAKIGLTESQKSLIDIKSWLKGLNDAAQQAVGINSKTGETVTQDSADAQKARNSVVAFEKVKALFKGTLDDFNNIGLTEAEKAVRAANIQFADMANLINGSLEAGLISTTDATYALGAAITVFQDKVKSLTNEIDKANKLTIDNAGKYQQQVDLKAILDKFAANQVTITTTQKAVNNTNSGYAYNPATGESVSAENIGKLQSLWRDVDALKQAGQDWLGQFASVMDVSQVSGMLSGATQSSDLASIAEVIYQAAQSNQAIADLVNANMGSLGTFSDQLSTAFDKYWDLYSTAVVKGPTPVASGVTTTTTQTQVDNRNNQAMWIEIYNWFKPITDEFISLGTSEQQKAIKTLSDFGKGWWLALDDAIAASGNDPVVAELGAEAKNRLSKVVYARLDAIFKPLNDDFAALGQTDYQKSVNSVKDYVKQWADAINTAETEAMAVAATDIDKTNIAANAAKQRENLAAVEAAKMAESQKMLTDFMQPFKDSAATRSMGDYQKELYNLAQTYGKNVEAAKKLGISETDLAFITAQYSLDLEDAAKKHAQAISDFMQPFNDASATRGMSDLGKELYNLQQTFSKNIEAAQKLGVSEAELATIRGNYAADQQAAKDKARQPLETKLYELTHTEVEAVARARKLELAALDESLRPMQEMINKLTDLKTNVDKASQALKRAVDAEIQALKDRVDAAQAVLTKSTDLLNRSFDAEKQKLTDSYNAQIESMTASTDKLKSSVSDYNSVIDSLSRTIESIQGAPNFAQQQYQQAKATLNEALTQAKGGNFTGLKDKVGTLGALGGDVSKYFATSVDMRRDQQLNINALESIKGLTGTQLSSSELLVTNSEEQLKTLKANNDAQIKALDDLRNQTLGVDTSVVSVEKAISTYNDAKIKFDEADAAYKNNKLQELYDKTVGIYEATLSVADALNNYQAAIISLTSAQSAANNDPIQLISIGGPKLPGFAIGTNYVPSDMTAQIHQGERIIPAADNRELLMRLSEPRSSNSDNSELLAELKALRKEVAELKASNEITAKASKKTADTLLRVTRDGDRMIIASDTEIPVTVLM